MSDIVQGSEAWFIEKLGKASSTGISNIMAKGKGLSRKSYMYALLGQRVTGKYKEFGKSRSIDWGTENEGLARAIYELETGHTVTQVGFINHPTIPMCGVSPDGLVLEDGSLEIKCLDTANHLLFWKEKIIPLDYQYEMTWQMCCTGRRWCDYVNYDPRVLEESKKMIIKRFEYAESLACDITEAVVQFLSELNELEMEFMR